MVTLEPNPFADIRSVYIDGKWENPEAGVFDDVDPATGRVFAAAPDAGDRQMEAAIVAARAAFDDGEWPRLSGEQRGRCLEQLAEAITRHADDLAALGAVEWGMTVNERMLQVDGSAFTARDHAGHARRVTEESSLDSARAMGADVILRREPVGVVAAITPWNFPHTLNVATVAPALAAGNTVVLKPSPLSPLAGLALAKMVDEETDIPPGVLNVVTTTSLEAARRLGSDPRVDMVSFTGSSDTGRQIMTAAAPTLKRLLLELGGKSAAIYLDDVDLDAALPKTLFASCTMHAGQACILTSRLLVPDRLHDDVVARLAAMAAAVTVGPPTDPASEMGPLISEEQRRRVEGFVASAVDEGATVVTGGRRPPALTEGFYYEPTVFDGVRPAMRVAREEIFGPVVGVVTYGDLDEAVAIANDSDYGLSGSVWSADPDRAVDVARRVRTGILSVNGAPLAGPYGGFKQSGIGRQGGRIGLDHYTELKAICRPAAAPAS